MFGKNNHVIAADTSASHVFRAPVQLQTQLPIRAVAAGTWHAVAVVGNNAQWRKADELSDISDVDDVTQNEDDVNVELEVQRGKREASRMMPSRERTTLSLADFYGPSPSPTSQTRGIEYTCRKINIQIVSAKIYTCEITGDMENDDVITPLSRRSPSKLRTPRSRRRPRRPRKRPNDDAVKRSMTTTECLLAAGEPSEDKDVTHSASANANEDIVEVGNLHVAFKADGVPVLPCVKEFKSDHQQPHRELLKLSVSPALDLREQTMTAGARNLKELRLSRKEVSRVREQVLAAPMQEKSKEVTSLKRKRNQAIKNKTEQIKNEGVSAAEVNDDKSKERTMLTISLHPSQAELIRMRTSLVPAASQTQPQPTYKPMQRHSILARELTRDVNMSRGVRFAAEQSFVRPATIELPPHEVGVERKSPRFRKVTRPLPVARTNTHLPVAMQLRAGGRMQHVLAQVRQVHAAGARQQEPLLLHRILASEIQQKHGFRRQKSKLSSITTHTAFLKQ